MSEKDVESESQKALTEDHKWKNIRFMESGTLPAILGGMGGTVIACGLIAGMMIWPEGGGYGRSPSPAQFVLPLSLMLGGIVSGTWFFVTASIVRRLAELSWFAASVEERKHLFSVHDPSEWS